MDFNQGQLNFQKYESKDNNIKTFSEKNILINLNTNVESEYTTITCEKITDRLPSRINLSNYPITSLEKNYYLNYSNNLNLLKNKNLDTTEYLEVKPHLITPYEWKKISKYLNENGVTNIFDITNLTEEDWKNFIINPQNCSLAIVPRILNKRYEYNSVGLPIWELIIVNKENQDSAMTKNESCNTNYSENEKFYFSSSPSVVNQNSSLESVDESASAKTYFDFLLEDLKMNFDSIIEQKKHLKTDNIKYNFKFDYVDELLNNFKKTFNKKEKKIKQVDYICKTSFRKKENLYATILGEYCPWYLRRHKIEECDSYAYKKHREQLFAQILKKQERSIPRKLNETTHNLKYNLKIINKKLNTFFSQKLFFKKNIMDVNCNNDILVEKDENYLRKGRLIYNPDASNGFLEYFKLKWEPSIKQMIVDELRAEESRENIFQYVNFCERKHFFKRWLNYNSKIEKVADFIHDTWGNVSNTV
ncbi:hypothetical protein TBLA_0E01850 [Henningerozyma blattae CBS 6284]|uniref:Uncharacterized protein n=1 Tax=Henningerozyma blattae (strain ATCC 34711 / CBS 6284 / DSM 70876 / NBRC 10599 / NRRL Y-10934 / UCD 77-7) TaxID=1071380 RepID=I2H4D7_HENB6|nr:hypothetical protein TBLA_0E01850 [Tetrapisispora blattae CBS 6284]CCH61239.1 hypothetical protein TBLA_0E01850 [Tetrapisispora blattae CBS 6284]